MALLTLVLTYHENDAPQKIWLFILMSDAMLRVMPDGRLRKITKSLKYVSLLILILIVVPFIVMHIRVAIYPQLETANSWRNSYESEPKSDSGSLLVSLSKRRKVKLEEKVYAGYGKMKQEVGSQAFTYDPNAMVQTGPGLPNWRWKRIKLNFSGPVSKDQKIKLWLISPKVNLVLAFLRVTLLILLILCVLEVKINFKWKRLGKGVSMLLMFFIVFMPKNAFSEFPSQKILDELRKKIISKPNCPTECAQIQSLNLKADDKDIFLEVKIHSAYKSAVPIPSVRGEWIPHEILINNKLAKDILRDSNNVLWVLVDKGINSVKINGSLPFMDTVQISMPVKPKNIETKINGWTVSGIYPDGKIDSQLQLRRVIRRTKEKTGSLDATSLPPFIVIERKLSLGLSWNIITKVLRLTPKGNAIVLKVPLIDGESVTTPGIRVKDGSVLINMDPKKGSVEWVSTLEKVEEINLKSMKNDFWTEKWTLDASPIWHFDIKGIPVIHHQDKNGVWMPQWSPWPGESATIVVTRPKAVSGQQITIDYLKLHIKPGLRFSESKLNMTMRASRGGEHIFTLPDGSKPKILKIDGKSEPVRKEGNKIFFSLSPKSQKVEISFSSEKDMSAFIKVDEIDIGSSAVNTHVHIEMPEDRWVLLAGGATLGPAVQFWSRVTVLIILSICLGFIKFTPLKATHWFLLSLGLTQVHIVFSMLVIGWILALGARKKWTEKINKRDFNYIQVALCFLTFIALIALYNSIAQGLLGLPEMQVAGNGSSSYFLKWYQDRILNLLPRPWVFSVSIWYYKTLMLSWSLWLAFYLVKWLKWGWTCFSEGGYWRKIEWKKKKNIN